MMRGRGFKLFWRLYKVHEFYVQTRSKVSGKEICGQDESVRLRSEQFYCKRLMRYNGR